ncbi:putative major facilitator superfamily transporter protein [Diplogelasinospora grovesii]|uniref:Major facilitator superfamily transporter protein n=1 Tax=Diplogelasinospora grovesii TaxID=303347 RepID=A0AAN6S006_9PEZI|nr:putative major facilitator superfamily transporter protein [Diplogelasinospora grovesii]
MEEEDTSTEVETEGKTHQATPSGQILATGEPESEAPVQPPKYSVYTLWEKRLIVLAASISAFFSPLTAQIYLPALPVLASEFHVSDSQINLTVTTYMIFQGVTPMFIGGLADSAGRRPAYVICFVIYIAANIGLALSKSYASVMVVRCLQSAGSSTTVALCQAVVADIVTSAERGQYIGITAIPIVLAPSLGPVLGGLLSEYLGWRWIFWFLTILATADLIALLLFFPETCRRIVGDGSVRAHPVYRTFWQMIKDWRQARQQKRRRQREREHGLARTATNTSAKSKIKFRLTPPNVWGSVMLLFEKELGILLGYSAILFSGFYAIATAIPSQFSQLYGFSDLQVGLMYLPMAGGSIVAAFIVGPTINKNYRRHAAKLGLGPVDKTRQADLSNFPIERARLEIGLPLLALSAMVMICWGWAMQYRASVAVPCVLLFLMGVGMIGFSNSVNVLIVDIYPGKAGAAVAANNLTRCLLGAAASAVIVPMINAMGAGWAYTLIGLLYVVGAPLMWLVMRDGIKWRKEIRDKEERKRLKKEEKERKKNGQTEAEKEVDTENGGDEAVVASPEGGGKKTEEN